MRLHVSEGEQERRIGLATRSELHKLTSLETLRRLRNDGLDVEQPARDLDIDTEQRSSPRRGGPSPPHFKLTQQHVSDRFPSR